MSPYANDRSRIFTDAGLLSLPILACAYALILSPLILFFNSSPELVPGVIETPGDNKIVWPVLAVIALYSVATNRSRDKNFTWPPHMLLLLAYLALASASVLWAFSPQSSFVRLLQQFMVVTAIALPAAMTNRSSDLIRGLFLCFGVVCILNVFFVMYGTQTIADGKAIGYSGYFSSKNSLGECAATALLLSIHELCYKGRRQALGLLIAPVSIYLMLFANSKTALGLALLAPLLAAPMILLKRLGGISPATVVITVLLVYEVISVATGFSTNRISYLMTGEPTFTGRQTIWDFAVREIAQKPFLGWGYQSFWLIGPTGPSVTDGPGWVKLMPNAHNGYYDTMLELGYAGLILLAGFIIATLHVIGRVAKYDAARAWGILSLVLFFAMYNGLESLLFRGYEFVWLAFLLICGDICRYWQPSYSLNTMAPRMLQARRIRKEPNALRRNAVSPARLAEENV